MLPKLRYSADFWNQLLCELYKRGDGRQEAGALLLGRVDSQGFREVHYAVYYDDIDPNALSRNFIHLDCRLFGKVWKKCRASNLCVVADVHTHPRAALQSWSDRANPMIPRRGHIAIIVPNYAIPPVKISDVGVFEYRGSGQWVTLNETHPYPRNLLDEASSQ